MTHKGMVFKRYSGGQMIGLTPSLDRIEHAIDAKRPVRTGHPFIVPVDETGRPMGPPSAPTSLLVWLDEDA